MNILGDLKDLKIRLQPKQSELWDYWDDTKHARIGFGGARGGAKSGGGRRCMVLRRLNYPQTTGLILRRTVGELQKSHLAKLFEEYPELRQYWLEQKKQLVFPNGSVLFFGSAQYERDMDQYYSAEFADILVDEAQEFGQSELERLTGSNRSTSNHQITPKMILTFMPGESESGVPPKGLSYLKRVFVDMDLRGEEKKQTWAFIQAFSWDNIEWARKELARDGIGESEFYSWSESDRREYFLQRTEYGATLASITDPHLRDAWLYGKWDVFSGQYFTNFQRDKHVIPAAQMRETIKPWWRKWLSGDWGYEHPHCVYWHAQDEQGAVWTYREMWGREVGEIDLGKRISQQSFGEKLIAFPFSWDAGKLSPRSHPELPKSMMQLMADSLADGLPKPHPADSSPGSRVSGARLLHQLLDTEMWHISDACPHLIECLPSLLRDPEKPEDVLKVDFRENGIGDDPYDAARMGIQHMLGTSRKPLELVIKEQAQAIQDPVARHFFMLKNLDKLQRAQTPVKPEFVPTWQSKVQR